MPLTGELSDLSLAELLEFFCNKRRCGRLKVVYPEGESFFYLKSGGIVHASFGKLRGIEAVHYALSLPNASFSFTPEFEPREQSIDQHWTSIVLDGLRQIDEGVRETNPVPESNRIEETIVSKDESVLAPPTTPEHDVQAFGVLLSQYDRESPFAPRRWSTASVFGAIILVIAAVGVPWGWYTHSRAMRSQAQAIENARTSTQTDQAQPGAAASPGPAATINEVSKKLDDKQKTEKK